jgi:hypothetical protein
MANDADSAWAAFGRLTHTAQDFYAHSNYIELWLTRQPAGRSPAASDVDAMDSSLLRSPALRSGKVYVLEVLTMILPLRRIVMPLLPRDSHAWMNIDSPERGSSFKYVFQAAVKRTRIEFEKTTKGLAQDRLMQFVDAKGEQHG